MRERRCIHKIALVIANTLGLILILSTPVFGDIFVLKLSLLTLRHNHFSCVVTSAEAIRDTIAFQ